MLNYEEITILSSSHSKGKTYNDKDRCQYWITSEDGNKYVAFKEKGSVLANLPIGTRLKIGWVLEQYHWKSVIYTNKVIQWFEVFSTPLQEIYSTKFVTFSDSDIEIEYQQIESILGID